MSFKAQVALLLVTSVANTDSFGPAHIHKPLTSNNVLKKASSSSLNNFFKDLMDNAFANDESLPTNKGDGQLDAEDDPSIGYAPLTATQERWKQNQSSMGRAPPVNENVLVGSKWNIGLFLAGIPDKDPSNDLYGRKVNISSRDKSLGIGAQVDTEPNVIVEVTLDDDGVCRTSPSEFTSGEVGQWKLSQDKTDIRFSIDTLGFTRTVQTTGTINKIYWSKENDTVTKTSSTYSIPAGFVYADAQVGYGAGPNNFVMKDGSLMFEKSSGLLGVSSKMLTCGKFVAEMVKDE